MSVMGVPEGVEEMGSLVLADRAHTSLYTDARIFEAEIEKSLIAR